MTTHIYGLKDPNTDEIRYVGKARNPKARFASHMSLSKADNNTHKKSWIRLLAKQGQRPELVILETLQDERWQERELWWIEHGLTSGWPLTNIITDGVYRGAVESVDWSGVIANYLKPEERPLFAKLSYGEQKELCMQAALEMMNNSWVAIKRRGGDPKIEFDADRQFWSGSERARQLLGCI